MLAARLHQLGKAKRLLTSGDPIPELGMDASTANATARLWQDLGIPASDIVIGRGASTGEELLNVKRYMTESGARRVGLLTSAWHMRRALRHAEKNGLSVVPVPADFWTQRRTRAAAVRVGPVGRRARRHASGDTRVSGVGGGKMRVEG